MSSQPLEDEKVTTDQYGRRKWNVEVYEKEAKSKTKDNGEREEIVQKYGLKADEPSSYLDHRNELINELILSVNKFTVINPANNKTYGKDKRFGFFCQICDLSFRDNLALIDHFNKPSHIEKARIALDAKANTDAEMLDDIIRRASVEEVQQTLMTLIKKHSSEGKKEGFGIRDRIKLREAMEQRIAEKRRERKRKLRMKKSEQKLVAAGLDDKVESMMGFASFGSTKK